MTRPATDIPPPDLRFVPVDALVPHEQHDGQRAAPLARTFRGAGVLRNPPVVTPLAPAPAGGPRYMVVDGANRSTAAREAGLPHIVVQVVAYAEPTIRLRTWHHALAAFPREDLDRVLAGLPGLARRGGDVGGARAALARREALAYIDLADGETVTLHGGADLRERNALLNAVVDAYRHTVRFYRVTDDSLAAARARHADVSELVVFPRFEPAELLELAGAGARLPAGITRHLIAWRALRINVPLERLADRHTALADKNRWLQQWLDDKLQRRQVRFYEEPTVLFDE